MRIVSFNEHGKVRFGLREGALVRACEGVTSLTDVLDGPLVLGAEYRFEDLDLLTPVPVPGKVICIGLNYRKHAEEGGNPIPDYPAVFLRVNTSLVPHGKAILRPPVSDRLDYEAELAVVIGRTAVRVTEAEALDYVGGYACFNDGSLRDYQRKSTQWTMGKNFDRTGGFGPDLVTPDELPAGARDLRIVSRLNGKIMQDGNTSDMIFTVEQLIACLSAVMTLEPGDVIATGTTSGVGYARTPPVFMKPGDVCEIEIDGIGTLENRIEDTPL